MYSLDVNEQFTYVLFKGFFFFPVNENLHMNENYAYLQNSVLI